MMNLFNNITEITTYHDNNVTVNSSEAVMSADANVNETSKSVDVMMVIKFILSFIGIIGNLTVLIVFLNHRKFRKKIPNIYIINQVSFVNIHFMYDFLTKLFSQIILSTKMIFYHLSFYLLSFYSYCLLSITGKLYGKTA